MPCKVLCTLCSVLCGPVGRRRGGGATGARRGAGRRKAVRGSEGVSERANKGEEARGQGREGAGGTGRDRHRVCALPTSALQKAFLVCSAAEWWKHGWSTDGARIMGFRDFKSERAGRAHRQSCRSSVFRQIEVALHASHAMQSSMCPKAAWGIQAGGGGGAGARRQRGKQRVFVLPQVGAAG